VKGESILLIHTINSRAFICRESILNLLELVENQFCGSVIDSRACDTWRIDFILTLLLIILIIIIIVIIIIIIILLLLY